MHTTARESELNGLGRPYDCMSKILSDHCDCNTAEFKVGFGCCQLQYFGLLKLLYFFYAVDKLRHFWICLFDPRTQRHLLDSLLRRRTLPQFAPPLGHPLPPTSHRSWRRAVWAAYDLTLLEWRSLCSLFSLYVLRRDSVFGLLPPSFFFSHDGSSTDSVATQLVSGISSACGVCVFGFSSDFSPLSWDARMACPRKPYMHSLLRTCLCASVQALVYNMPPGICNAGKLGMHGSAMG